MNGTAQHNLVIARAARLTGLWQIHDGGPAMFHPVANAATAVRMSADGTNWSPWTTAAFC
jgi:hypothetical protein